MARVDWGHYSPPLALLVKSGDGPNKITICYFIFHIYHINIVTFIIYGLCKYDRNKQFIPFTSNNILSALTERDYLC